MAKRFTDTGIWEKEWFMKLSPKHKCLFRYLTERCDAAGVWEPNWHLASVCIGEAVNLSDTFVFADQIETLPNGKIWLSGFINFQYGNLSEKSPAHIPVFKSLKKNNLCDRVFNRVANTLMEKDKEEVTEKEEEKEKESAPKISKLDLFEEIFSDELFVNDLQSTHRGKDIRQSFEECYTHHSNAPNPPTEAWQWKQKLNTWLTIKKHDNGTGKKDATHARREGFARRHS